MSSSSLVVMLGRPVSSRLVPSGVSSRLASSLVACRLSSVVGRRVPRLSFDGLLSAVAPSSPSLCVGMLFVGVVGIVCI